MPGGHTHTEGNVPILNPCSCQMYHLPCRVDLSTSDLYVCRRYTRIEQHKDSQYNIVLPPALSPTCAKLFSPSQRDRESLGLSGDKGYVGLPTQATYIGRVIASLLCRLRQPTYLYQITYVWYRPQLGIDLGSERGFLSRANIHTTPPIVCRPTTQPTYGLIQSCYLYNILSMSRLCSSWGCHYLFVYSLLATCTTYCYFMAVWYHTPLCCTLYLVVAMLGPGRIHTYEQLVSK